SGDIRSPNYPSNYPNNADCRYRINAGSSTRTITLTFSAFNLEGHSYCKYDFVDIRVGFKGNAATPVRKYCGSSTPAPITITGQQYVYIQFSTDGSVQRSGFRIQYTISGISQTPGSTGLIKSPNYPSNYPKNTECKYRVNSGTSSNSIAFNFLAFNLEPNTQCRFDYLQVFNGPTTILGSIGKYCGSTNPSTITRTTSYMSMKFKTDGSVTRSGFNVRYSITGASSSSYKGCGLDGLANCKGEMCNQLRNCHLTNMFFFVKSSGDIRSPNYPSNYPNNADCRYRINAGSSTRTITLTFSAFNLESHSYCKFDYLEVFNGPTTTTGSIGKYCGSTSPNIITQITSDMSMKFKTDGSITHSGFNVRYSISVKDYTHAGSYFPSSGVITSPSYPANYHNNAENNYTCSNLGLTGPAGYTSPFYSSPNHPSNNPHNLDCYYRINAQSSSNVIKVTFQPFNLEKHSRCNFDYVAIYEGANNSSRLIGKLCGTNSSFSVKGRGQFMYMHYHTDSSVPSTGFRFKFSLNLGGAPGSTGLIKSPNFPSNYPKNIECKYRVNSGVTSNSIAFLFLAFNLEPNPQCRYDYLQVFNGPTTTSRLIGKYCGVTYPNSITQTTSDMSMKFKTDGSITHSGFNIRYS
uniref:CUB domain-containing protein n=1 Tax=Ciona savignyi TaxID=51511 RepID=H2ZK53_CIOSA